MVNINANDNDDDMMINELPKQRNLIKSTYQSTFPDQRKKKTAQNDYHI